MEKAVKENVLIDEASLKNRKLGANLKMLLRFGVVGIKSSYDYRMLVNYLQTVNSYDLITGFEHNWRKGLVWLDNIDETLKKQFRS